jgi:hypothetical protein
MKPRKAKASEPSLRDRLSANFLAAFQADFEANGVAAIEQLRQKSPEKYADIAARLIATTEPGPDIDFTKCKSIADIGRSLLRQAGMADDDITDAMIEVAVEANNRLVDTLESIAAPHRAK